MWGVGVWVDVGCVGWVVGFGVWVVFLWVWVGVGAAYERLCSC